MTNSLRIRVQDGLAGLLGSALSALRGARAPRVDGRPIVDHWSLGGVGPATVAFLADRIRERKPRRILECGPGVSTIAMARALEAIGSDARIVSLEHDERWARLMRERLGRAGVDARVDLLVGALAPGDSAVWYSCAAQAAALGPFDFVFIDGPPATDGLPRRAPALPLMWDAIADDALIILDDGKRRGERASVEQWRERFGDALSCELLDVGKGLWVMTKRSPHAAPRVACSRLGVSMGRREPRSEPVRF